PSAATVFFYGSGDPPALHSFPTRRSSDLHRKLSDCSPWRSWRSYFSFGRKRRQRALYCLYTFSVTASLRCRTSWVLLWEPACLGDRKSTRLNSSHVKISYAVFCLKKKMHS